MATFDKNASAHCLSLLVANRPGVLVRIALVFSRRGYILDSLVCPRRSIRTLDL